MPTRGRSSRCGAPTKASARVVALCQATPRNSYHHGACRAGFTRGGADEAVPKEASCQNAREGRSQHMSTTTEHIGAARAHRSTFGTLRLRLKPAHRYCGFVQGGWWPRSTRLTAELQSLLAALSLRFGRIDRVRYHQSDWPPTPSSIKYLGGNVILDASHDSPNIITVFGQRFGRLALLVVPPYTDADDADAAMTTAASIGDASTSDQLLGIRERSATDRHRALSTLPRWDCALGM